MTKKRCFHEYHFHDYKKDGVPEAQLRRWIDALGWDTVINRRGTTWRKLDQSTRDNMDAESAVAAAQDNAAGARHLTPRDQQQAFRARYPRFGLSRVQRAQRAFLTACASASPARA